MSKYSKAGLFRECKVSVIMPGQKDIVWRAHPKPGRGYSSKDLDGMIENAAEWVEKNLPTCEFRLVELGPNEVKFIYAGKKHQIGGEMGEITKCPERAQSVSIATNICSGEDSAGHKINVFQKGMKHGPQGPEMETIIFCEKCGFGLSEIRGEIDRQIQAAVEQNVKRILAAQNPPPVPGAGGPFPIPAEKEPEQTLGDA